jgi:hypothetical protein
MLACLIYKIVNLNILELNGFRLFKFGTELILIRSVFLNGNGFQAVFEIINRKATEIINGKNIDRP